MKRFSIGAGTILAGLALALPAQASVAIADFAGTSQDITWTSTGSGGTLVGSGDVNFTFLDGLFSEQTFSADMMLSGAAPSGSPALNPGGIATVQPNISGSMEYIYEGPTTSIHGVPLVNNVTVLLSATYINAEILAPTGQVQGDFTDPTASGGTVNILQALGIDLAGSSDDDFDFTFSPSTVPFGSLPGRSMTSFSSGSTGSFAIDIPEPFTWAMMLVGVSMIGFMARGARRRQSVGLAAV